MVILNFFWFVQKFIKIGLIGRFGVKLSTVQEAEISFRKWYKKLKWAAKSMIYIVKVTLINEVVSCQASFRKLLFFHEKLFLWIKYLKVTFSTEQVFLSVHKVTGRARQRSGSQKKNPARTRNSGFPGWISNPGGVPG